MRVKRVFLFTDGKREEVDEYTSKVLYEYSTYILYKNTQFQWTTHEFEPAPFDYKLTYYQTTFDPVKHSNFEVLFSDDNVIKSRCECGSHKVNSQFHSTWCPEFLAYT